MGEMRALSLAVLLVGCTERSSAVRIAAEPPAKDARLETATFALG